MEDMVSIIIPVYNCEEYIEPSIMSCINQTYRNIEIIVVNDGSTDNTSKIVDNITDKYSNVKLFNISHSGKVKAINEGINQVCGKYIAIHAADDVCFSYRIEEEVKIIEKNPNITLVFGDMEVVDEKLTTIKESFWKSENIKIPQNNHSINLLYTNYVSGGTILFGRELIDKIFPIPETLAFEDWWIAFICSSYGELAYTYKKLIRYRQHNNNDNSAIKEKNINNLIERREKLILRNYNYYKEFIKFIDLQSDYTIRNKQLSISNCMIIKDRFLLSKNFFERLRVLKVLKIRDFITLNAYEKNKFIFYLIFGRLLFLIKLKLLRIKTVAGF